MGIKGDGMGWVEMGPQTQLSSAEIWLHGNDCEEVPKHERARRMPVMSSHNMGTQSKA